jgi:hypothetical protein
VTLRRLAEATAWIALQGDPWIQRPRPISDAHLGCYLQASRECHQGWRNAVDRIESQTPAASVARARCLLDLWAEVLVTEMFTRLWSAVSSAADAAQDRVHADPIARHVLISVIECRTQHLTRLVTGEGLPVGTLTEADGLRRKFDRWTDLLIGEMAVRHDVLSFAIDPVRAADFRDQSSGKIFEATTARLMASGLRSATPDQPFVAESAIAQARILRMLAEILPNSAVTATSAQLHAHRGVRGPARDVDLPPAIAARLGRTGTTTSPRRAVDTLSDLLRRLDDAPGSDSPQTDEDSAP